MALNTIWHNPRCAKSRTALKLLNDRSIEVKVFKEVFDGDKWNTAKQNSELAQKIKKSILDSAQELYIANEMS